MKLLADENTPRTIIEALRYSGYDILWVREYCPGMSDEEVACLSISENLIILTFDKDFGELVYRLGMKDTPGVILARIVDNQICQARVLELLSGYGNRLRGYFTVLTESRIRRRSLLNI
jgi:predicted nuclease of predicted toxin-antitoxin system